MQMQLSSLQIEAFFTVARLGSFTKAAKALGLTQPALSQRLANLELELESILLIRDRSGVRLTESGQDLLGYCQAQAGLEAEIVARFRGNRQQTQLAGFIRVATFSSIADSLVLQALAPWLKENSGLRLALSSHELHELPSLLKRGEVDYVLGDQDYGWSGFSFIPLGEEINALYQARDYSGANVFLDHDDHDTTTSRYLETLAAKIQSKSLRHRNSLEAAIGAEILRARKGVIERHFLDDMPGILAGLQAGLGRAVIPTHLAEKRAGLVRLFSEATLETTIILGFREPLFPNKKHTDFIACLKNRVPKLLQMKK